MYSDEQANYLVNETTEIIKLFYLRDSDAHSIEPQLIKKVCDFYNHIKDYELGESQLKFLYKFSIVVGVPQYFDMLLKYKGIPFDRIGNVDTDTFTSVVNNAYLSIGNDVFLHKYQKQVLDMFSANKTNRFFLTAPTSFGKTYIVYEILKKINYRNILLVFPTLSLLAENYSAILNDPFFDDYTKITFSDYLLDDGEKHIWVYTPERLMSMLDKNPQIKFDFSFLDEVYKIDNTFILDNDTVGENERDISYRIALKGICERSNDMLLAGPYIDFPKSGEPYPINFFLQDNNIKLLEYNEIEIVKKDIITVQNNAEYSIDDVNFVISNKDLDKRIAKIVSEVNGNSDNSLIYCDTRRSTESRAIHLASNRQYLRFSKDSITQLQKEFLWFIHHLEKNFSNEWCLVECLKKGIGIHHGYIPKFIQKDVIKYFNCGIIDCLFTTTTITEGVNTTAKNMIVLSTKKGDKPLKKFDAQNIAERAGRFIYHYEGRVISLDDKFEDVLYGESNYLNHIDYDVSKNKSEVDIMESKDKYLTLQDRKTKSELLKKIDDNNVSKDIIFQFKSVPLDKKIKLYFKMTAITESEIYSLKNLIVCSQQRRLDWDGFEVILKYCFDIIDNEELASLISHKTQNGKYSVLTVKVHNYIESGYEGVLKYHLKNKQEKIDTAVKNVSRLTFNVFKYHLVKYVGLFDLFYRYVLSQRDHKDLNDITGFSVLIQMLEYACTTKSGKIVSDFGTPFNVVKYIDTGKSSIATSFDAYEKTSYEKIKELFHLN